MIGPMRTGMPPAMLDGMTFLNEVDLKYPNAISLASGRPSESFFHPKLIQEYQNTYLGYRNEQGSSAAAKNIFQYGSSKGIMRDLISKMMKETFSVEATEDSILVTSGCQEGLILSLETLTCGERDVILVPNPVYLGVLGAAHFLKCKIFPVQEIDSSQSLSDLANHIKSLKNHGFKVKALYAIPDSANPSGNSIPVPLRRGLLKLCQIENFYIIEDATYQVFSECRNENSLLNLDTEGNVIHLGSFSKTISPSLRLGYIIAATINKENKALLFSMQQSKSFLAIFTSSIAQAVAGGMLIEYQFNLRKATKNLKCHYQRNKFLMLNELQLRLGTQLGWSKKISWNTPAGGFFVVLTLPFEVGMKELEECAKNFNVIWTPMLFFDLLGECKNQLRLSFSYGSSELITEGIARLAKFCKHRILNAKDSKLESNLEAKCL